MRPLALLLPLALVSLCKPEATPDDDTDGPADPVAEEDFTALAAEVVCAQLFACECSGGDLPWPSEAECIDEKHQEFQALFDEASQGGGVYSPECGGEYIDSFTDPECEAGWEFYASGGEWFDLRLCPIFVAERDLGDACVGIPLGNDCGIGKTCGWEGFCIATGPLPVGQGDSCEVEYMNLPCADGLLCRNVDDGRACLPPAELGDPCPNYDCAGGDLYCDGNTNTCVATGGEGEPCDYGCSAGLYCDGGQEFTCQPKFEYGHGCANDSVCADGGLCIANICEPPPALICAEL